MSTMAVLKQLMTEEGIETLYRGIVPVLQSLCISNFVYFYTFHSFKALRGNKAQQSAVIDLLMGAISGVVNVLTTTPFWVVNTRLKMKGINALTNKSTPYDSLMDGLFYIAKSEGLAALWAGALPSLILVSNPAIQFMTYEAIKRRVTKNNPKLSAVSFFAIGAVSKAIATVLTYPLQLIQTKLRHGSSEKNLHLPPDAGVIDMLMFILKRQGIAGLFRGLEAKLLQTVLTAALMFMAYEKIARFVTSLLLRQKKIV